MATGAAGVVGAAAAAVVAGTSSPSSSLRTDTSVGPGSPRAAAAASLSSHSCSWKMASVMSGTKVENGSHLNGHGNGAPNAARAVASEPGVKKVAPVEGEPTVFLLLVESHYLCGIRIHLRMLP